MNVFVVISNFFDTGMFGTYSTIKRARMAVENYFNEESSIVSFEDIGDYTYEIHTSLDETFYVEIASDLLDYEFMSGALKEDK